MEFKQLKNIFENNDSFLITTHVNPDADGIGSEAAIYFILKKLGKHVFIVNYSQLPYNLAFLDPENKIETYSSEQHDKLFNDVDVLICVDFNRSDRIVKMQPAFVSSNKIKVCIDHHQDPENFVDFPFIDDSYCATGEIIYDFIKQTGIVLLDKNISEAIYAAIMTDTGSFRFERTSSNIHIIAAELLSFGVIPGEVYDKIYERGKFSRIKLLGSALSSMKLYGKDDGICYMVITQNTFGETSAEEFDTDGFVNFALSVEGVKIGMMFIELKEGFKVSFRSKGSIPVNKLAATFGGGGHVNASGARFHDKNMNELLPIILSAAEKYLKL